MTQHPSGWYDDPQDPSRLRYWDGVVWTDHTADKQPTLAPQTQPVQDTRAGAPGLPSFDPSWSQQQAGAYPGAPGMGRRTADGAVLSGWWRRVGANLVDALILSVINAGVLAAISGGRVFTEANAWMERVMSAASAGATTMPPIEDPLAGWIIQSQLVALAVGLLYEILLLSRFGFTPGRWVTGILVREKGRPGPPSVIAVLKRSVVKNVINLVPGGGAIGALVAVFQMVDYLWPLRDKGNQAIHDKAGGTEVIRGRGRQAAPRG